jgi:lipopolysaccharide transport system permease protein
MIPRAVKNTEPHPESTLIIEPPKKGKLIDFFDLWHYRELLYAIVLRDITIRYKQTGLGFGWAVLQPLVMMGIFSVVFGGFAKISSDGIPYPLFCFTALIPWILFSEGLIRSTNSMTSNAHIINKVYFPRIILPISGILSPLVDFLIAFIILMIMMLYFGILPAIIPILALPFLVLLILITSLGAGLWLSALNVKFRDFQYIAPFLVQIGFFATPIIYSSTIIPEIYRPLYGLNPLAGVIDGFRWTLFGTACSPTMISLSIIVSLILLVSGLYYFKQVEYYFADVV